MSKYHDPLPIEDMPWIDRHSIEDVLDFQEHIRGSASSIADLLLAPGTTSAQSFMTAAQQGLKRFGISGRANQVMSETTFRFGETKDKRMSIFIVGDASRNNALKDANSLLQFCMFQELKRHPNLHVPVWFICDEATNYMISDLPSFLSWARGFGVRIHIIIQFISEFRRKYGPDALKTLQNVWEIIQILPGSTEHETLQFIQQLLGETSVVAESQSSNGVASGIGNTQYSEQGKPLLTLDQIRRLKKTILFIRQNKPMLVDLPPIAAISPFRKQIGIDPFHGKPFLKRVKLRLEGRDGPLLWRIAKRLWRVIRSRQGRTKK